MNCFSTKARKTVMSSVGRTTVWPLNPWRRQLSFDRGFPSSVRGPVEWWAFSRFALSFSSVMVIYGNPETQARMPAPRRERLRYGFIRAGGLVGNGVGFLEVVGNGGD